MPNDNQGFTNEIQHYEKIREFIRQLFRYGDRSNNELKDSGRFGGTTTVSYHIKRLKHYLSDERILTNKIKTDDNKTFKSTSIVYDPLSYPINNLVNTFQECKFNVKDLLFYFNLMQSFVDDSDDMLEDDEYEDDDEITQNINDPFTLTWKSEKNVFNSSSHSWEVIEAKEGLMYKVFERIKNNYTSLKEKGLFSGDKNEIEKEIEEAPFSELSFREDYFYKLKDDLGLIIQVGSVSDSDDYWGKNALDTETKEKKKDERGYYYYRLTNDIFKDFCNSKTVLPRLLSMIRFFYNKSDIAVPGWQLSNTLETYMYDLVFDNPKEQPCFQFSDSNALTVIDNDVLWDLLCSIHRRDPVIFCYTQGDEPEVTVFPIRIISERQYGRQYLMAYHYNSGQTYIYRIDRISKVRIVQMTESEKYVFIPNLGPDTDIQKELDAIYEERMKYAWNIDFSKCENPKTVLLHFKTAPDRLDSLLHSVSQRHPEGIIFNKTENGFDYKITLANTIEIKPWIRGWGSLVTVDLESNPELYEEIKNEFMEILKKYEPVQ